MILSLIAPYPYMESLSSGNPVVAVWCSILVLSRILFIVRYFIYQNGDFTRNVQTGKALRFS